MANFYGHGRSNHFQVKDQAAFEEEMKKFPVDVYIEDDDRVCLLSQCEEGWAWNYYDRTEEDTLEINWNDIFKRHLMPDSVAVIIEVGNEKLRYLMGYAIAFNHLGQERSVHLDDIYDLAKPLGTDISHATY